MSVERLLTTKLDYEKSDGNYIVDADGNILLDAFSQVEFSCLWYHSKHFPYLQPFL